MPPELLVGRLFGVEPASLDDATSNATLAQWTSLAHVNLVLAVESAYGVHLTLADALEATSVGALKRVLRRRGARW
jgi:acyl carrier protein